MRAVTAPCFYHKKYNGRIWSGKPDQRDHVFFKTKNYFVGEDN